LQGAKRPSHPPFCHSEGAKRVKNIGFGEVK
jgi:hypothetical protein